MAAKLRVRKLARRIGCTPEQILKVLHELGETRYRSPSDMLPPDLTARLERALELAGFVAPERPQREPAPEPPSVAPPPPRYLRPPAPAPAPAPAAAPAPVAPPAPAVASAAPIVSAVAAVAHPDAPVEPPIDPEPVEAPTAAPAEGPSSEELQELNAALERRVAALEEELAGRTKEAADATALQQLAIERLLPSEMRVHELQEELAASQKDATEVAAGLQQRINQAEVALKDVTLAELAPTLSECGLESPAEMGRLLAALLASEWARRTMEHLRLVHADRFLGLVKQKMLLHCGDPTHTLPEGCLGLRVAPASRCQIGAGRELLAAAEGLVLKCRPRNYRRMLLVGGDAMDAAELTRALTGRVEVQWVGPDSTPTPEQVDEELQRYPIVVLWTASPLPYSVGKLYAGQPRVIEVDAPGLQGLLRAISEHI